MTPAPGPLSLSPAASLALGALALGAARAVPVAWQVAPIGGARLPAPLRVGLGLLLAAQAAPSLRAAAAGLAGAGPLLTALLVARELLVGAVLGLVASLPFRAAEAAGWLADTARGATLAGVLLPTSDEQGSPLGALYLLLACVAFLEIGGIPRLCTALAHSYGAVPIAPALTPAGAGRAAALVVEASARFLESAISLAAPVLVALWLAEVALAMIARAVPDAPAFFLSLPLKGLLGLGVVLVGLGSVYGAMARGLPAWLALVGRAVGVWP